MPHYLVSKLECERIFSLQPLLCSLDKQSVREGEEKRGKVREGRVREREGSVRERERGEGERERERSRHRER